jgi:hypothetical protein
MVERDFVDSYGNSYGGASGRVFVLQDPLGSVVALAGYVGTSGNNINGALYKVGKADMGRIVQAFKRQMGFSYPYVVDRAVLKWFANEKKTLPETGALDPNERQAAGFHEIDRTLHEARDPPA